MDSRHLRSLILKVQDFLSDNDRQRLHFFLANDVPRTIRDDPSMAGTLNLMESLFDQAKISEENFTFLIDVFKEIQCVRAVELLREHKKIIEPTWSNQPTLPSEHQTLTDALLDDQEDKKPTLLNHIKNCGHNREIIKINDTNINPVKFNVDKKHIVSSHSEKTQSIHISFNINKYIFFTILSFMMIVGFILVVLSIGKIRRFNHVEMKVNGDFSSEKQRKQNRTFELDTNDSLIKVGEQFGDTDGTYFDDSSPSDFTCSHYFNGLLARADDDRVESYQFFYYSPHGNQQEIQSPFHGNENFLHNYQFSFDKDEKIMRVEGQFVNKTILSANGTNITKLVITGIKFTSNQDHDNPLYNGPSGQSFSESFQGYTLGYVTGRSGQYIEQLQFFWYRT